MSSPQMWNSGATLSQTSSSTLVGQQASMPSTVRITLA